MPKTYNAEFEFFWGEWLSLTAKTNGKAEAERKFLLKGREWAKSQDKNLSDYAEYISHRCLLERDHRKKKKKAGDFVPEWKQCSTWINQECYEDEFPESAQEITERTQKRACSRCDQEASIGIWCEAHHEELVPFIYIKDLRDKAKEQLQKVPKSKDQSWHDWFITARKELKLDTVFKPIPRRLVEPLDDEQWEQKYG